VKPGEQDEKDDDLEKSVREVLEGGAEVQGGTAIPTDPEEDQVEKQYESQDEDSENSVQKNGEGPDGADSPALQNFY